MTPNELKELVDAEDVLALSLPLQALRADARGDWDEAHTLCQRARNRDGDWVHAYLHRKEGDLGNAGYWYHQAGREMPGRDVTPDAEWAAITSELLG